jgi:hypothetical protein
LGLKIALLQLHIFAKDVNLGSYKQVPSGQLLVIALVGGVEFLDKVLGVFNNDFVGLSI